MRQLPHRLGTRPSIVCELLSPKILDGPVRCWLRGGLSAQYQHLIVWIDLTRPESEEVIRDAVTEIVNDFLPGVRLAEMTKEPF